MNSNSGSSDDLGGTYAEEDFAADRHSLTPANIRVASSGRAPAPFENRYTFALTFVDEVNGTPRSWVCLNATGPAASPPPGEDGPVDCACQAGAPFRRFGPVQHLTWIWQPDRVRERSDPLYYAAFIPDYFGGEGPCPQRDHPGLLTQWDAAWVENDSYGGYSFTDHIARDIADLLDIDNDLQEALGVGLGACTATPLAPPHRGSVEELRQWWAAFVRDVLLRRGAFMKALIADSQWQSLKADRPGLYESLRDQDYFRHGVRGVWVFDTVARVASILELIRIGVPVFYVWHESMRNVAPALEPPHFEETPPRYNVTIQRHLSRGAIAAGRGISTATPAQPSTTNTAPRSPPTPNLAAAKRVRVAGIEDRVTPGSASPTRPSPSRGARPRDTSAVPRVAEEFTAHKWIAIPQDDFGLADAVKISTQSDGALMTVQYRDSTPPPSHEEAAPSLLQRLHADRAPPLPRRTPYRQRPVPRLRISAEGRAMQVISREADAGRASSAVAIVQVALRYGLPFRTPVAVVDPAPGITIPRHVVHESYRIPSSARADELWDLWAQGVAHLIGREHVARAGLMLGGAYARIIKEFLPEDYVFQYGPSRGVVDYGVPLAYRLECGDDNAVHDDYLSDDERSTLLGCTTGSGADSLWPDIGVLRKCEYEAVWTVTWDDWFVRRLDDLKNGEAKPLSWREWKSALRAVARSDDFTLLP